MRSSLSTCCLYLALTSLASLPAVAQDAPLQWGGFQTQGSVTTGYRFTTVKGRTAKYRELFNLRDGFRLTDFNLFGQALPEASRFADDYSLTTSGLGGDPFPAAQLSVRKTGLYDLRVSYRQSYYYWDRNDDAPVPGGFRGMTTNHDWATVRKLGSAQLNLRATDDLRFGFEYLRNSRDGVNFTSRSLHYTGASSAWAAFARANPYYAEAPLTEGADRVTGSISLARRDWSLHYRAGYQTFDSTVLGTDVTAPQRSINVDEAATANELLTLLSWNEFRQLKTPVSEFSYIGRAWPALELRGGYLFYRYRGPASLDSSFAGTARTNTAGTQLAAYSASLHTETQVTEPSHVFDQGFTYRIGEGWNLLFDYRYAHTAVDSDSRVRTVRDGVVSQFDSLHAWRLRRHGTDLRLEIIPARALVVTAGLRFINSDIQIMVDGVEDEQGSRSINTVWPSLSISYQPSQLLSIRGSLNSTTSGTSYTRISPRTDVGGRVQVRLRPVEKLEIENNLLVRNRRFDPTDFENTIRNNATHVSYQVAEPVSVFAGFSYDSFLARNSVSFLRGTPPLDVLWRDQVVSRNWQAGFSATPYPRLGVSFSGNYLRTTGLGEISGELPLYGPLTFPYATASLFYDFPRVGRWFVDLQRTHYSEEIIPDNNFRANLLTIRWTKEF